MEQMIYVASHDPQGGIYRFSLSGDGRLTLLERYPMDRPAWLCRSGNKLYALLREPFMMHSGVAEFDIRPDGSLQQVGKIRPTHGAVAAHILCWRGSLYAANYLTGTTVRLPDKIVAHSGSSVNPRHQDCSHPHCLTPTPDGKYLCINDLGTDCIYVCTPDLEEVSRVSVPAGSGPRHLVFSRDGRFAYGSNEMASTVSVFSYCDGVLTHLKAISSLPGDFRGENSGAAIRLSPDGRTLYASNRGHDSVCIWDVEGDKLTGKRFLMVQGQSPREMVLAGKFLLCGNEGSATITVFNLETGELTDRASVVRPWGILPVQL